MSDYIIVRTFCDKREIADLIVDSLLNKKLVAGSQISEIDSKYWWGGVLECAREYKIEFRSRKDKFDEIVSEIRKLHDYDVAEISSIDIDDANDEFFKWIDESIEK